jgi:hypothetical protein
MSTQPTPPHNQIPPEPLPKFTDEWCEWKRTYFAAELEDFHTERRKKLTQKTGAQTQAEAPKAEPAPQAEVPKAQTPNPEWTTPSPAAEPPAAQAAVPLDDKTVIDLHPRARYGFLGRVLDRLEPATEVRIGITALLLLVVLGNEFGHRAWVILEAKIGEYGHKQYPTFFAALVGRSGKGRKGTALALILSLVQAALGHLWDKHRVMSVASGEGIIHAVRDKRTEMKEDKSGAAKLKVTDYGVVDKRKIIVLEEMSKMFNLASNSGNIILDVIRDAADGKDLHNPTKNSEERATDPTISMITNITKGELWEKMGKTDATNGVLNRFVWGWSTRNKKLPRGKKIDISDLAQELAEILAFSPGEVRLSEAAEPVWDAMYEYLNPDDPDSDTTPIVDSIVSRGDMYLCRLALIFALLDRSYYIEPRHLQAAWAVWTFSDTSSRRIFGTMISDATANKLIEFLKTGDKSSTEIRDYFSRNVSPAALARAIEKLPEGTVTSYDQPTGKMITTMYHYDPTKMCTMFPRAQDAPWLDMTFPDVTPNPQNGVNPFGPEAGPKTVNF